MNTHHPHAFDFVRAEHAEMIRHAEIHGRVYADLRRGRPRRPRIGRMTSRRKSD